METTSRNLRNNPNFDYRFHLLTVLPPFQHRIPLIASKSDPVKILCPSSLSTLQISHRWVGWGLKSSSFSPCLVWHVWLRKRRTVHSLDMIFEDMALADVYHGKKRTEERRSVPQCYENWLVSHTHLRAISSIKVRRCFPKPLRWYESSTWMSQTCRDVSPTMTSITSPDGQLWAVRNDQKVALTISISWIIG